MDAYALLQQDHEAVKAILADLAAEKAPKRRESLFVELNLELTVHARAEERFLHPLLAGAEATREAAREAAAEREALTALLGELEAGDKGAEPWLARLRAFRERVERHLEAEEAGLYRMARLVIGEDEAGRLGAAMEAFRDAQIHAFEL